MRHQSKTTTAIPLYVQIAESLIREIASGRLTDGQRLPPERVLADQYRTTVRTLRKSLSELEKQGMLERIHGSGNYVRSTDQASSIYSMFRLELYQGGGLPTADFLSITEMEKPSDLPEFGTSSHGVRFRRLRFLDLVPIAVEEIWLDGSCGVVDTTNLSDSLYRFYRMSLGFWIIRAEDRISIGQVPDWAPQRFARAPGDTVGFIERFSWAQRPETVEYSRTWFDTDKARYVSRIT
ncbi:MAG: GntR family transcriptional regulator [Thalassovita sp.]